MFNRPDQGSTCRPCSAWPVPPSFVDVFWGATRCLAKFHDMNQSHLASFGSWFHTQFPFLSFWSGINPSGRLLVVSRPADQFEIYLLNWSNLSHAAGHQSFTVLTAQERWRYDSHFHDLCFESILLSWTTLSLIVTLDLSVLWENSICWSYLLHCLYLPSVSCSLLTLLTALLSCMSFRGPNQSLQQDVLKNGAALSWCNQYQPMDLALKWIQDAPVRDTVDHIFLVNMVPLFCDQAPIFGHNISR